MPKAQVQVNATAPALKEMIGDLIKQPIMDHQLEVQDPMIEDDLAMYSHIASGPRFQRGPVVEAAAMIDQQRSFPVNTSAIFSPTNIDWNAPSSSSSTKKTPVSTGAIPKKPKANRRQPTGPKTGPTPIKSVTPDPPFEGTLPTLHQSSNLAVRVEVVNILLTNIATFMSETLNTPVRFEDSEEGITLASVLDGTRLTEPLLTPQQRDFGYISISPEDVSLAQTFQDIELNKQRDEVPMIRRQIPTSISEATLTLPPLDIPTPVEPPISRAPVATPLPPPISYVTLISLDGRPQNLRFTGFDPRNRTIGENVGEELRSFLAKSNKLMKVGARYSVLTAKLTNPPN